MKTTYITIALILLISIPFLYFFNGITGNVVYNPVDCEAKFPTCDADEINVLDISSFTNAHISANNPTYFQICCSKGNGINQVNVIDSRIENCDGTNPLKFYTLDNNHLETSLNIPHDLYPYDLCINSDMECVIANGISCSSPLLEGDYFCLLKYKEVEGFTDTNAHVSDCSDTFYEKSICCTGEVSGGGECGMPGATCLEAGASTCCQPTGTNPTYPVEQFCSTGYEDNPASVTNPGNCCPEGQYWDPEELQCIEQEECYIPENPMGNPELCNYLISEPEGFFNLDHDDCIQHNEEYGYHEACCDKPRYGTQGFYYCKIESV